MPPPTLELSKRFQLVTPVKGPTYNRVVCTAPGDPAIAAAVVRPVDRLMGVPPATVARLAQLAEQLAAIIFQAL